MSFFKFLMDNEVPARKKVKRDIFSSDDSIEFDETLFEVVQFKFHYGQGKENPLKNLYYFEKEGNSGNLLASEDLDPSVLPNCFCSVQYMLIYKGEDRIEEKLKDTISSSFESYFTT